MRKKIESKLAETEEKYNVKILLACETGSRAWGFPSPDSDYDVRMIYMHEPDWYLTLKEKKDTIEFMSSDGELDITGWDVKKTLLLMWKSNAPLLERVQSPIVYRNEDNVMDLLREYCKKCFSPIATTHHYLSMAIKNFNEIQKEEIKLKKLFYALRATLACKWIRETNSIPPILFSTLVNGLDLSIALKKHVNELLEIKKRKEEKYFHPAVPGLNDYINKEIQETEKIFRTLNGRIEEPDLDVLFRTILKNYWK